jgi:hypothetical protein
LVRQFNDGGSVAGHLLFFVSKKNRICGIFINAFSPLGWVSCVLDHSCVLVDQGRWLNFARFFKIRGFFRAPWPEMRRFRGCRQATRRRKTPRFFNDDGFTSYLGAKLVTIAVARGLLLTGTCATKRSLPEGPSLRGIIFLYVSESFS